MTDDVKGSLRNELQDLREAMVAMLDGLGEYDIRRPLTPTGTNLLGLVKHLSIWESRYLGAVFGRPFPEPLPQWDDREARGNDLWATEHETRGEIVDRYHRVWKHADETISELDLDSPGHVPWWPRPTVTLFGVLIHQITETSRHAGHADILREQLDGTTASGGSDRGAAFWQARRETIEQAAKAASDRRRP